MKIRTNSYWIHKNDKAAINNFTKWEDIVITKTDKGENIVIMYSEEYMRKANQQLQEKNF